jgi:sulfur dioxygenase
MTQPHATSPVIQLFEPESCTYTYIVYDPVSLDAVIIDPVDCMLARDLAVIDTHQLKLRYILETHTHADHITSAAALAEQTGAVVATSAICGAQAEQLLKHNDVIKFGELSITVLHTPGHTEGSISFYLNSEQYHQHVFTGDCLLINGCGRTDFQLGNAQAQYQSITQQLFTLPESTTVWPGHDYRGNQQSTIGIERAQNARLVHNNRLITEAEFVELMNHLELPMPKRIHEAVPANLVLGAV